MTMLRMFCLGLATFSFSINCFANDAKRKPSSSPTYLDVMNSLSRHYSDDPNGKKFDDCKTLLIGGKPWSVVNSYQITLTAASFAEGLIPDCVYK